MTKLELKRWLLVQYSAILLILVVVIMLTYETTTRCNDLEQDLRYTRDCYNELLQEVDALQADTTDLRKEVKIETAHVDNILYNVLGGQW